MAITASRMPPRFCCRSTNSSEAKLTKSPMYLKDKNDKRAKESSEYKVNEKTGKVIDKGLNRSFLTKEQAKLSYAAVDLS